MVSYWVFQHQPRERGWNLCRGRKAPSPPPSTQYSQKAPRGTCHRELSNRLESEIQLCAHSLALHQTKKSAGEFVNTSPTGRNPTASSCKMEVWLTLFLILIPCPQQKVETRLRSLPTQTTLWSYPSLMGYIKGYTMKSVFQDHWEPMYEHIHIGLKLTISKINLLLY